MCGRCYAHYGQPKIDNEKVRKAASLIDKVYEMNMIGGGLHVAIDDWNLDGKIERWEGADNELEPQQIAVEKQLAAQLNDMTLSERASALAIHDRFWKPA